MAHHVVAGVDVSKNSTIRMFRNESATQRRHNRVAILRARRARSMSTSTLSSTKHSKAFSVLTGETLKDDKKELRRLKNRESAIASRQKKLDTIESLSKQLGKS